MDEIKVTGEYRGYKIESIKEIRKDGGIDYQFKIVKGLKELWNICDLTDVKENIDALEDKKFPPKKPDGRSYFVLCKFEGFLTSACYDYNIQKWALDSGATFLTSPIAWQEIPETGWTEL